VRRERGVMPHTPKGAGARGAPILREIK